jgi:hypothetical protein
MSNDKIGKIVVLVATGLFDAAGIIAAFYWGGTEVGILTTSVLGVLSTAVIGVVKLWYNVDVAVKSLLTK